MYYATPRLPASIKSTVDDIAQHTVSRHLHLSNQIRMDQPRTARRVGIPPEHQHHSANHEQPHVSAHPQRLGRCDADAE